MSQTPLASLGFLAGVIAVMVDGRRAVRLAALAAGLGLAPAAASVGGAGAAALTALAGLGTWVTEPLGRRLAGRARRGASLDPLVPVVAPRDQLFGPRSIRAAGGALALLAASWVSLNVIVGEAASDRGAVFAAAYIWLVGGVRFLRARALEDLGVAAACVALASAAAWVLETGAGTLGVAAAAAALAPGAALVVGWLGGRRTAGTTARVAEAPAS